MNGNLSSPSNPWRTTHVVKKFFMASCGFALLSTLSVACMTGPRPTLGPTTSLAPVTDPSIVSVMDLLSAPATSSFTVTYDITTKYGGLSSTAEVTADPQLGIAIVIEDVLFVIPTDDSAVTCTWSEETLSAQDCTSGVDEARVSYLQLNSRVFKDAAVDRMRRESQVAADNATTRDAVIAERDARCVDIPVIDANGAQQTKSYCAYADLGVIASLDTADLAITAVFVDDIATSTLFDAARNID